MILFQFQIKYLEERITLSNKLEVKTIKLQFTLLLNF
jgi:hypothetical protein